MPLSEHEEQVFADLERQLRAEDPTLLEGARALQSPPSDAAVRRKLRLSIAGMIMGVLSIIALTLHIAFGVVGFVVLLVSITTFVQVQRQRKVMRRDADRSARSGS